MEPPAWWVKWKPLRWVLAILVVYWFFGTLLPQLRESQPPVADSTQAQTADEAAGDVPAADMSAPAAPAAIAEAPKPAAPAEPEVPAPTKPLPPPVQPPAKAAPVEPVPEEAPVSTAEETAEADQTEEPDPAAPYMAVEATRVELINSLHSYDNLESIQSLLAGAGHAAELSTIEKDTQGGRYPPYRSDTLVIKTYQHAGVEGVLTLEFFNDRLYQSHFIPKQPTQYLEWLRTHGLPLPMKRTGRSKLTLGDLEVATNIDFAVSEVGAMMNTTPYVQWTDTRLSQQMRNWGPIR